MTAPVLELTANDFNRALMNYLPRGRAWPKETDSTLYQMLAFVGATFERLTARDNQVLTDAFPPTTVEMLPEWEAALGLPDPCLGPSPSDADRVASVVAKFLGTNGLSRSAIISYAAAMGYTITIEDVTGSNTATPLTAGMTCGQPTVDYSGDPNYSWMIHAAPIVVTYAAAGSLRAGDPLATWTYSALECVMDEIKPAHTVLVFDYS